jgi:hypothetical protein
MPMDPAMMGGGGMPMDPMAMAAGGADPAAIMAAQGAPVDPMMAQAGGAGAMPPPPAEAAPAEAPAEASKGGGQKEKIDEIYNMLTKVMGILVGKGLLAPDELGGVVGGQGAAPAQEGGVPPEQKVASADDEPEKMGDVVEEKVTIPAKKAAEAKSALTELILALDGSRK